MANAIDSLFASRKDAALVDCVATYKCLGDETRLRILNLLREGPLCVCHVQGALQLPQSRVSKQLSYLKRNGLLASRRSNNWTIYQIADAGNELLAENLRYLEGSLFTDSLYKSDRARLENIDTSVACGPQTTACGC